MNNGALLDGTTTTTISTQNGANQPLKKWTIHICMVEKNEIYHLIFTGSRRKLTGKQVSLYIEEHAGIPVSNQQLFFGDHEVRPDDTGATLKIENGAIFVLFSRCPDGCCYPSATISTTTSAPNDARMNSNENSIRSNKNSHTSSTVRSVSLPKSAALSSSTGEGGKASRSLSPARSPPGLTETEDTPSSHFGMGLSRSTPPFRDQTPSRSPSSRNLDDAVEEARRTGKKDVDPRQSSSPVPLLSSTSRTNAGLPVTAPLALHCSHTTNQKDLLLLRALLLSNPDGSYPTPAPPRLQLAGVSAAFKTYTTPIQTEKGERNCILHHSSTSSLGTTPTPTGDRSSRSTRTDCIPATRTTTDVVRGVSMDSTQGVDRLSKRVPAVENEPFTGSPMGTFTNTSTRSEMIMGSASTFTSLTTKTTTPVRGIEQVKKMMHYSPGSSFASVAPPSVAVTTQGGKKTTVTLSSENRRKSHERDLRAASASTSVSDSDSAFLFSNSTSPSPSFY